MFWIKIPEIKKKKNSWDPHCRSKWAGITSQKVRGHGLSHYKKKFLKYIYPALFWWFLKKVLFDDDSDDTVATAHSFDEVSHSFNASAKEMHITD